MWIYIGTANRLSFSILYQYLQVVRSHGACPHFFRSNKGEETILAATAHYTFYLEALTAGIIPPDGTNSSRLESYWIWGSSKQNIRIEALWR
jgi:hypothetical protein